MNKITSFAVKHLGLSFNVAAVCDKYHDNILVLLNTTGQKIQLCILEVDGPLCISLEIHYGGT